MLKIKKTNLDKVIIITPPTIFEDFRGKYIETYNKKIYTNSGIKLNFVQDDVSISKKNVLRGIHGDNKTWKLISCLHGKFLLVVVNNDKKSKKLATQIPFGPYLILASILFFASKEKLIDLLVI